MLKFGSNTISGNDGSGYKAGAFQFTVKSPAVSSGCKRCAAIYAAENFRTSNLSASLSLSV